MRFLFSLVFLFLSFALSAQNAATIHAIDQLVGPEFYFDSTHDGFSENSYMVLKGKELNTIVIAWNKDTSNYPFICKIFVLEQANSRLRIVDSSTRYERDGKGPRLFLSNDTLKLEHGFHGGYYSFHYTFNEQLKKYILNEIVAEEVIHDKKLNNFPIARKHQFYNINKQTLTIEISPVDNKKVKHQTTIIKKALPKNFIPDLAHYIDPLDWTDGDNSGEIYQKIFE